MRKNKFHNTSYFFIKDLILLKPIEKSVLIPPSISFTYEFDFNNINIDAVKIILLNILEELIFKENINNKTRETKTWINNNEIKDFIQFLNKIDVDFVDKDKKAKGAINTKIFNKIYLIP